MTSCCPCGHRGQGPGTLGEGGNIPDNPIYKEAQTSLRSRGSSRPSCARPGPRAVACQDSSTAEKTAGLAPMLVPLCCPLPQRGPHGARSAPSQTQLSAENTEARWKTEWPSAVAVAPKPSPGLRRRHGFSKLLWSAYCVRGTEDQWDIRQSLSPSQSLSSRCPQCIRRLTLNQPVGGCSVPP